MSYYLNCPCCREVIQAYITQNKYRLSCIKIVCRFIFCVFDDKKIDATRFFINGYQITYNENCIEIQNQDYNIIITIPFEDKYKIEDLDIFYETVKKISQVKIDYINDLG